MLTIRILIRLLLMTFLCAGDFYSATARAQDLSEDDFKTDPSLGKGIFTSTCAGCHGLDGRGSAKAPNIVASAKVQHLSNAELSHIISNGVPGTGMPAFRGLNPVEVRSVVGYLRLLQGKGNARLLPGSPARGKAIFYGKGECSTCHAISGEGGFLGPELTTYGSATSPEEILKALTVPARTAPAGYRQAAVTTHDGTRLEGIVRDEDNFSLQLQTQDGSFHFFQKADLEKLEYLDQSLMPADYGKRLTQSELNDLISYLMSASSALGNRTNSKTKSGNRE